MRRVTPRIRVVLALVPGIVLLIVVFLYNISMAADPMCQVCENKKHPHTKNIKCSDVDKFLMHHPGSYAGPCTTVSSEKPPKPTPTPKPPKPAAPTENQAQPN